MWLKYLGMHNVCLAIKNEEVKGQGELPAYHVYFDKMHFLIFYLNNFFIIFALL
jgi:hypothetical protein